MNLLYDRLPTQVYITENSEGDLFGFTSTCRAVEIDWHYDTILRILKLLNDDMFPEDDRVAYALELFYVDNAEAKQADEAHLAAMFDFICPEKEPTPPSPSSSRDALLDFEADSSAIYSFFFRTYGIDLIENRIHWYKFSALLQDISETSLLSTLVHIRSVDIKSVPKNQRAKILSLKNKLGIKSKKTMSLEERDAMWRS